jgi:arabinogalactan endo-1,4-beta-galactosidase
VEASRASVLLVAALLVPLATWVYSAPEQGAGLIVNPVPGLPADFIRGVDLSEVPWILELGGKYYYENGTEGDILDILAESGVNWIRLRVWNDPYDERGNPYGGGNCDLRRMASFAAKAKAKGFKVLVDFHYSDWWADPSKQYKPKAWANLTFQELVEAVYEWTYNALAYMDAQGALPDMVQVGNEINNGFLWPDGSAENWTQFVTLLKSAIKAVRDYNNSIKVVIHLSGHREVSFYVNYFKRLVEGGVDFDVIALSFYTYWHGTLEKLRNLVETLAREFKKDVIVAEVAYAWTLENGDDHPNIFGSSNYEVVGGYKATVQGQASLIRDVIEVVYRAGGRGIFYWGAAWIPYPGAGWKTGEGNPWDNQALFDFSGKALPSLKVFKLVYEAKPVEVAPLELYDPRPIKASTYAGVKPVLPGQVLVVYTDHSIRQTPVDWGEVPVYKEPGVYEHVGYVVGTRIQVRAVIEVRERMSIEVADPEGDDRGPGTYKYPSAAVYKPGVFDIVKVVVSLEGEEVVVKTCFRSLGGNPWQGPNGFSLQYIQVYIRTTNPAVTNKVYRKDTFGLGIELREDYAWQYALLIAPGWGTEPLPRGELSALQYANGTVFVEDKHFSVAARPEEGCVEARVPRNLMPDWENIKLWRVVAAVTSWAGENPDRIRSFAPGGGEWVVDATGYANETTAPRIAAAIIAGVLPKVMDLAVYSEEYPSGISAEQQYAWLLGFDPAKPSPTVVPPPVVPYVTITVTHTITQTLAVTETATIREVTTVTAKEVVQAGAEPAASQLVATALLALSAGVATGYFAFRKFAK